MKTVGIICEYNPFHNGHIYHLEKVKEMFPDSLIILVMSGNFTQRGIPSVLNKWDKTEIALNHGIDLVIELPFTFATQGADVFAKGAISILKELDVDYLVFGSESDDVDSLKKLVDISLNNLEYQEKIKLYLDQGINYPTALSKALEDFSNSTVTTPNDLLAFSYIKEIIKQDAKIEPISIKRTNDYHSKELEEISSATSIREALITNKDISKYVPEDVYKLTKETVFTQENYFKFLKYKIETTGDLSIFQTVDEGVENRIKKYIHEVTSWEELVNKIKTKRYTYNKINRMLTHILCGFTKELADKFRDISYIRVLGFNELAQKYLNKIKKDVTVPIVTKFNKDVEMLDFEMQTTCVYASVLNESDKNLMIKTEYQNKPKMKKS